MVMLGDLGSYVPSVNNSDTGPLSFLSGLLVGWLAGIFVLIFFFVVVAVAVLNMEGISFLHLQAARQ